MQTKLKLLGLGLIAIIMCIVILGIVPVTAMAETTTDEIDNSLFINDYDVEPYALFVSVSVAIDGANGEVWAAAQTKSAIFAKAIYVVLELYSSDTYQDSYLNMTLEKRVSTANLAKGDIIKAVMPTNGVQKYWRGRMYYKADSANWKYAETSTALFDPNGIVVL